MENYYSILNINRSATASQVRQSYLRLARLYHPDTSNSHNTEERFKEISKAYGVLADPIQRARYDCSLDVKQFLREPFFKESFLVNNENMDWEDEVMNFERYKFPTENVPSCMATAQKDPPVEHDLFVSLEEFNTGVVKKLKIKRQIVLSNRVSTADEKVLLINVKPGWKAGTKVTFANEGDQKPGISPADVVITIREKHHQHFSRDSDNNLIYNCQISLKDALICDTTDIPTLDGRTLRINHGGVIGPGSQTIVGEGLPLPTNPHQRANLIVKYHIIFPQHLSVEQKQVICDSLPEC